MSPLEGQRQWVLSFLSLLIFLLSFFVSGLQNLVAQIQELEAPRSLQIRDRRELESDSARIAFEHISRGLRGYECWFEVHFLLTASESTEVCQTFRSRWYA